MNHKKNNVFFINCVVICLGLLLIFSTTATAQIPLSAAYTQNFNTYDGYTPPSGWAAKASGTGIFRGVLSNSDCNITAGGLYALGSVSDYSFGCLYSTNGGYDTLSVNFTNNTGNIISSINLEWDYRQYGQCNRTNGFECSGLGELLGNTTLIAQKFESSSNSATPIGSSNHITLSLTGLSIPIGASFGIKWIGNGDGSILGTTGRNAVGIDNFSITPFTTINYYWNGASLNTPGTTGVTAYGGDGSWGATGAWVTPTNPGTVANWTDNVNAIFGGRGDNIILDANRTALSCQFNVDGYSLSTNAVGPINLTSSISLANNSNLTLNPNLNLISPASGRMGIGSVNGSGSSSINLQTARSAIPIATRVDLTSGAQINVPTIIYAAGTLGDSSLVGYCASAATDVIINGDITNNSFSRTIIGTSSDVSSNITVNGKITGTAGLQFSAGLSGGKGIVTLKAKNNYTGSTYFNGASTNATIKMGIDSALPYTTKVKMGLSTSNGGLWDLNGYNQFISSLTNGIGGGYITNNGANDAILTVSGSDNPGDFSLAINDGTKKISIVRAGTGTLSLTNANNAYSGSTTISGGVLSISNDRNLGATPATPTVGKINLNGGKLLLNGSFDINAYRGIALGGSYDTIDIAQGQASTYAGVITGSGNITKSGLGNLTLNGTNTYTGTTTIAGGSLTFTKDANFGAVPVSYTSNMINLNGGKLIDNAVNFYDTIYANRGINLSASTSDTIEVNSTSLVYGGKITGSGNLVKTGNGVLILSGSSDFTGSITINKGAIQLNDTNTNTLTANNNVIINNSGSQLSVNAKQSLNDITINSGGELYVANNLDTLTVSGTCRNNGGTINANGSIIKFTALENNAGTINANYLPGSLTTINISASLNMNNGTININNSDTLNIKPNASFTMSSGSFNVSNLATLTIDSLVTASITGGAINIANGGILNERCALPQASTYTLDNNGTVIVGPSNTTQYFPGTGVSISNIDSLIINTTTTRGGVFLNKNISNLTTLLKISSSCTFDAQTFTLGGTGALTMGPSSFLKLAKNNVVLPELTGAYNIPANSGTIVFYGTGTQTLRAGAGRNPGYDYFNFTSDTLYTHTVVFPENDSIGIKGSFNPGLKTTTYSVGTGNTFIYKGTTQTIRDFPYYSLELAGTGTKTVDSVNFYTVSNGVSVIDSLKIGAGLTLNMYGNSGVPATSKARNITLKSSATKTARIYFAPGIATPISYGSGSTPSNCTTGPYGFILERYVPAKKAWRLMANPLKDTTFQFGNSGVFYKPLSINKCWQEGQSTNGNSPVTFTSGIGTIITNGTSQSNGFDQGPNLSSSIKYYDSSLNIWSAISTTNSKITDHPGYLLYVRGDRNVPATSGSTPNNTVLRSTGVIARAKQTANFTYTNNASDTRYRLVGNPYPSAINFNTVTKTNVVNNYYLWDPNLGGANGVGAYVSFSWNGSSYDKSPVTSTLPTDGTIESGAAFFVQFSGLSGSLTFYETDKVATSSANAFGRSNDQSKKLILNLNGVNTDGTIYPADGVLLSFAANQNNDVDENDMKKINNFSENLGIAKGTDLLSIERRNEIENHDTIYLKTNALKQKTYQLECIPQNLTSNLECCLEDKYTNINTPLSLTDTSRYNFTINTDAGSYSSDRFKIIFRPSSTLPVKIVSFQANKKSSNIELNWKVENEINIKQYVIEHSENGYQFEAINSIAPKGNHLSIENYQAIDAAPSPLNNYYRIKAINIDGSIVYSEIASLLEKNTTHELTVFPNPVKNGAINILLNDKIQGNATIHIINAAGQLVYSDFIKSSLSKQIKINHLPHGAYQIIVKDESGKTWIEKIVKY